MSNLIEQLYAEMAENREATRAAEFRADQAEYEIYTRAKYSAEDKRDMLAKGHAIANANGDPSYPIADAEDLTKAIKAVGRGGSDHDAIRKHIITRAAALGLSSQIPDNWNADGSMKMAAAASADTDAETRDDDTKACPTCDGKGTIMAGHRNCPDCKGSGKVPANFEAKSAGEPFELAVLTWVGGDRSMVSNFNHEPGYRAVPEDIDERATARREQQVLAEILTLPEEDRSAMIDAAPEPDEIRQALNAYSAADAAIEAALEAVFGRSSEDVDLWVLDSGDDWAVFRSFDDMPGKGTFKVPFTRADDGAYTFTADPVGVSPVTTYEDHILVEAPPVVEATGKRDADRLALERERDTDAEVRARATGEFVVRDFAAFDGAKAKTKKQLAGGRILPATVQSQVAGHQVAATQAAAAGDHQEAAKQTTLALAKGSALSEHNAAPLKGGGGFVPFQKKS